MGPAYRTEEIPEFPILTDRRPGGLDELTSKPPVSRVGDRSSIGSLSGRVLGRHQAEKPCQLTDIFKLSPIPDASHKLTGHNPADPGESSSNIPMHLGQLRHRFAQKRRISLVAFRTCFSENSKTVEQLVKLRKRTVLEHSSFLLVLDHERPLSAGGCRGKLDPFEEQQRFDALLHAHHLAHKRIAQAESSDAAPGTKRRGTWMLLSCPPRRFSDSPSDCRAGWSSLFVLELWGSSMERRSSRGRLSPPTHHTIRTPSVQPRRQRPPSDRQSACAHDSQDAPRYRAYARNE